uniref:Myelin basic protein n=1 Tax=Neogobius melanostomus TaxID=47308 RepID=A0A8C6UR12_9GOBI
MASSSGTGHSAFGLGRKKKSPGLMDQISKIFAGDKKKRSKVNIVSLLGGAIKNVTLKRASLLNGSSSKEP